MELIAFIDNITKSVDIAKCDWPLITRIVICVDMCYEDTDNINTIEDRPNAPEEAQKVLIEVLRFIFTLGAVLADNMEGCIILEDVNNRE